MRFVKMHGIGNDYVFVDFFRNPPIKDPVKTAIEISRPHFGIGSDGLITIEPSEVADARMRIYNADGSEAQICGNGLRCVGKYLYDFGICPSEKLTIETGAGLRQIALTIEGGEATGATVNMGEPTIGGPVTVSVCGRSVELVKVSMGNPHAVALSTWPEGDEFFALGRAIELSGEFPERTNVEFTRVRGEGVLEVHVWERGSGETLACGSGACAALVAAAQAGLVPRKAAVRLPGGELSIEWRAEGSVLMTGPAQVAFVGEIADR